MANSDWDSDCDDWGSDDELATHGEESTRLRTTGREGSVSPSLLMEEEVSDNELNGEVLTEGLGNFHKSFRHHLSDERHASGGGRAGGGSQHGRTLISPICHTAIACVSNMNGDGKIVMGNVDDSPGVCQRSRRSAQTRGRKAKDRSKDPLIYKLTNLVNGKAYVGKAMDSHLRMWEHETGKGMRGAKKGKMQLVDSKIQQYGWDNFQVEWLETNVPRDQLLLREAHWMEQCKTLVPNGYNILKPGVEVISMDDPVIRARWEAANPEGVRKATASKRAKREAKLLAMDSEVADKLRIRLDKEAARNGKRHRGEKMEADGRLGRNDKRRATWAAKREAKMAAMSPEDAERYRKKCALSAASRERNFDAIKKRNQHPDHVAWMKGYREGTKGNRVLLG